MLSKTAEDVLRGVVYLSCYELQTDRAAALADSTLASQPLPI